MKAEAIEVEVEIKVDSTELDEALEKIKRLSESCSSWIPCEDDLPPSGERVYVYAHTYFGQAHIHEVKIGHYATISKRWFDDKGDPIDCVTDWMKLPKPPSYRCEGEWVYKK